jgi:hypothetical protein
MNLVLLAPLLNLQLYNICYYLCEKMRLDGAAGRNRTGTGILFPRDFKSLASTCFATAAFIIKEILFTSIGGGGRNRTGVYGFAGRCITTLLPRRDKKAWSGKRDSNSRPQPWQGCALPTELFPHNWLNED